AKPDKKALSAALKAGEEIPGARLVQGVRLNIA
ncbi:Siphovirus Gp157, partial [uncultured Caudovirales phage]